MSKMEELFEKVATDSTLQTKFTEIIKGAEAVGEEATKERVAKSLLMLISIWWPEDSEGITCLPA